MKEIANVLLTTYNPLTSQSYFCFAISSTDTQITLSDLLYTKNMKNKEDQDKSS